jgi:hypothetical protein
MVGSSRPENDVPCQEVMKSGNNLDGFLPRKSQKAQRKPLVTKLKMARIFATEYTEVTEEY